jgi:hypothetical protein
VRVKLIPNRCDRRAGERKSSLLLATELSRIMGVGPFAGCSHGGPAGRRDRGCRAHGCNRRIDRSFHISARSAPRTFVTGRTASVWPTAVEEPVLLDGVPSAANGGLPLLRIIARQGVRAAASPCSPFFIGLPIETRAARIGQTIAKGMRTCRGPHGAETAMPPGPSRGFAVHRENVAAGPALAPGSARLPVPATNGVSSRQGNLAMIPKLPGRPVQNTAAHERLRERAPPHATRPNISASTRSDPSRHCSNTPSARPVPNLASASGTVSQSPPCNRHVVPEPRSVPPFPAISRCRSQPAWPPHRPAPLPALATY